MKPISLSPEEGACRRETLWLMYSGPASWGDGGHTNPRFPQAGPLRPAHHSPGQGPRLLPPSDPGGCPGGTPHRLPRWSWLNGQPSERVCYLLTSVNQPETDLEFSVVKNHQSYAV